MNDTTQGLDRELYPRFNTALLCESNVSQPCLIKNENHIAVDLSFDHILSLNSSIVVDTKRPMITSVYLHEELSPQCKRNNSYTDSNGLTNIRRKSSLITKNKYFTPFTSPWPGMIANENEDF